MSSSQKPTLRFRTDIPERTCIYADPQYLPRWMRGANMSLRCLMGQNVRHDSYYSLKAVCNMSCFYIYYNCFHPGTKTRVNLWRFNPSHIVPIHLKIPLCMLTLALSWGARAGRMSFSVAKQIQVCSWCALYKGTKCTWANQSCTCPSMEDTICLVTKLN